MVKCLCGGEILLNPVGVGGSILVGFKDYVSCLKY